MRSTTKKGPKTARLRKAWKFPHTADGLIASAQRFMAAKTAAIRAVPFVVPEFAPITSAMLSATAPLTGDDFPAIDNFAGSGMAQALAHDLSALGLRHCVAIHTVAEGRPGWFKPSTEATLEQVASVAKDPDSPSWFEALRQAGGPSQQVGQATVVQLVPPCDPESSSETQGTDGEVPQ